MRCWKANSFAILVYYVIFRWFIHNVIFRHATLFFRVDTLGNISTVFFFYSFFSVLVSLQNFTDPDPFMTLFIHFMCNGTEFHSWSVLLKYLPEFVFVLVFVFLFVCVIEVFSCRNGDPVVRVPTCVATKRDSASNEVLFPFFVHQWTACLTQDICSSKVVRKSISFWKI